MTMQPFFHVQLRPTILDIYVTINKSHETFQMSLWYSAPNPFVPKVDEQEKIVHLLGTTFTGGLIHTWCASVLFFGNMALECGINSKHSLCVCSR